MNRPRAGRQDGGAAGRDGTALKKKISLKEDYYDYERDGARERG